MFGLSDNNDQQNDQQHDDASNASPLNSVPTAATPAGEAAYVTTPPPPVITPTPHLPAPEPPSPPPAPEPSQNASEAIPSAPVAAAPHTEDDASQEFKAPETGINGVHLENAYITTDPPHTDNGSPADNPKPTTASLLTDPSQADGLLKLKQQALQSLAPLVDQLQQAPEEKFKTTMMLIQASDNPDLVHEAFDAANNIPDEKGRAQALLDVVNEINYFTQHPGEEEHES